MSPLLGTVLVRQSTEVTAFVLLFWWLKEDIASGAVMKSFAILFGSMFGQLAIKASFWSSINVLLLD